VEKRLSFHLIYPLRFSGCKSNGLFLNMQIFDEKNLGIDLRPDVIDQKEHRKLLNFESLNDTFFRKVTFVI
jgi:hypothetical protein